MTCTLHTGTPGVTDFQAAAVVPIYIYIYHHDLVLTSQISTPGFGQEESGPKRGLPKK